MSMPYSLTCAYVEWTDQMKPGHETVWRQVFAFGRLLRDLGCRVRDLRAPMRDQDPPGTAQKAGRKEDRPETTSNGDSGAVTGTREIGAEWINPRRHEVDG